MPGTAIGTQMGLGYPGTYSRNAGGLNIAARLVTPADTVNINFGDAVVLNPSGAQASLGGNYSSLAGYIAGGGTATMAQSATNGQFAGFAVREVLTLPSFVPLPGTPVTLGFYQPGQPADVIEQGNVVVTYGNPKVAAAPKAGGAVFVRTAVNGLGTVVGTIEPAADGGNTLALTNCAFTTGIIGVDGLGNQTIEVAILARNTP